MIQPNNVPENQFKQKTTKYLDTLSRTSEAITKLYYYDSTNENYALSSTWDVLHETEHTVTKWLIHKYPDRVLALLSYTCAANCRFCERQGRVWANNDQEWFLQEHDIENIFRYVQDNKEIKEVVFSWWDPLLNPKALLSACQKLSTLDHIKRFRIHTKLPIVSPSSVDFELLQKLIDLPQTFYFSVHTNHPDELTSSSTEAIKKIGKMWYILLNQSVFLKWVNDNYETLKNLFNGLADIWVRPYYMYHCSEMPATKHFVMNIDDEIALMTRLRENISWIAFPQHALDMLNTTWKIIIPTNHINFNHHEMKDFNNTINSI